MSASASKKKRKELLQQGASAQDLVKKESKKKRNRVLRNGLIVFAILLVTAGIIFALVQTTQAERYKPKYDVTAAAATIGEQKVTVPIFNYFYNNTASTYVNLYMQYGLIEANKPLSEQQADEDHTWEEYFIETTKSYIKQVYNGYTAALKDGYTLTEDDKSSIQSSIESMKMEAENYGYSNTDRYLALTCGLGCTLENYEEYLTVNQIYTSYAKKMEETFKPTDEEIAAEYAANSQDYDTVDFSYTKIKAEAEETEDEDAEPTYTDEALSEARAKAEEARNEFPDSATTLSGTMYTAKNNLLENAATWLFDAARKEGDIAVFGSEDKTEFQVVRFNSRDDNDYYRSTAYVISITKDTGEVEEGQKTAEEKFNGIKNGLTAEMTDSEFVSLASEYGITTNNYGTNRNAYIKDVTDFLYADGRAAGDTETFENDTTYYIVRYTGKEETKYQYALVESSLEQSKEEAWNESIQNSYEAVYDEALLLNANTDLTYYQNSSSTDEAS